MIAFLAALIIQKTYIYAQDEDTVNYDSLIDEADYSGIDSTLDDYGWKGTSFKELVRSVASSDTDIGFNFTETVTEAIISNRTVLIQILLLSICAMFLTVLDKNASDSAMLFISFILMTLIVAVFINAARTGYECVQMSVDIYKALCPVFFPAVAYSCGASSAAAYYEIILFLMYIVNVLVKNVLMRCNYVYMILGMFDTFSEKDKFNKMCQLITKIIKLSVKGMLMFFLGLNGIKSLILPLSDSLKMSVLFKAVSMIPGIGNSAQTVSKTIAGSAVLVKNSIGVSAVIVMAVIIGIPLLKLVVMALLYQILGAVKGIITVVNLAQILGLFSAFLFILVLTFTDERWQLWIQLAHFCILLVSSVLAARTYGMMGFAVASLGANSLRVAAVVILGIVKAGKDKGDRNADR